MNAQITNEHDFVHTISFPTFQVIYSIYSNIVSSYMEDHRLMNVLRINNFLSLSIVILFQNVNR